MTTLWQRPVPLVGDVTSAAERAADPTGWAFPAAVREALADVVAARRDVRRYRPDQVPAEVLAAVLAAGHAAPSVGHSQPWRFLVVTDPATRERAATMADAERLRQAAQLEPDAARRLLDLQLEGIREAPLGVVVLCDRRTAAAGVLGRATFPDADVWSCACAIENMWLTARAEGLGMGWVTLFQPAALADLLGLPPGVVTLGWLCLGWPDERPPAPGLERAGWSRRAPLADVVLRERWAASEAPVSHLRAPDPSAVVSARDSADVLLTPPGSLGALDRAVDRVLAVRPAGVSSGRLVLVGADHPVARLGVTVFAASVTRDVLLASVAGTGVGVVAAAGAGLASTVVDAGVLGPPVPEAVLARRPGLQGDLASSDALPAAAAYVAAGRGMPFVEDLVVLGEVGVGNTTVAAALAAALLGLAAADVVGLGAGGDTATVARKTAVVQGALDRTHGRPDLLAALGGPEVAVLVGVVLAAAEAGRVVVLDGLLTSVAALLAVRQEPGVAAHLVAGQRSRERAHGLVLDALGLEPLLDLRVRAGEGVGGCLAASLLLQGLRLRALVARTA